jgi:predicted GIY-YIG superfamily endonuclease
MAAPVTYLVHLDQALGSTHPRGRAHHYLGQTVDLDRRLATHREGRGSRMLAAAANRLGIGYSVVRTWPGGRETEKRIKAQHAAPRLCPVCSPEVTS